MWEFLVDVFKALAVEGCKWGAVALLGWVGFKLRPIRLTVAKIGIPRSTIVTIILAVAISGFLNGAITILYDQYAFARLANWGGEPSDPPASININGGYGPVTATCPEGSYVVGVRNYGNRAPPYCIGCFVAVQVLCRKLNSGLLLGKS
jgi:hypothetical protein